MVLVVMLLFALAAGESSLSHHRQPFIGRPANAIGGDPKDEMDLLTIDLDYHPDGHRTVDRGLACGPAWLRSARKSAEAQVKTCRWKQSSFRSWF
jgi:hypothetical protein